MVVIYPLASQNAMSFDGPTNPAFAAPGGRLLTNAARDAAFPYIYANNMGREAGLTASCTMW
jgi:hypothetical protein